MAPSRDRGEDVAVTPFRGTARVRPSLAAMVVAATVCAGVAMAQPAATAAVSRWTGGVDLYRAGVFSTQDTWLWCTAADVQIIRNISRHQTDHSRDSQQRYFDFMRVHNRYRIPVKDGVDPGGWTAGLRRYVDTRYRLVASSGFDAALRSAVTNLRRTSLPVAITVAHGDHAWVLTGFTATADPGATTRFTVTSVRVTGPLWGLQSRSYGYDMQPDTKLTPRQLAGFFTPWHYAGVHMAWEGRWVSIQPIPVAPSPRPTVAAPKPSPVAPTPAARSADVRPPPSPSAEPVAPPSPAAIAAAGLIDASPGVPSQPPAVTDAFAPPTTSAAAAAPWAGIAVAVVALSVIVLFAVAARRPRGRGRARTTRPD
jgi:hypothetical protein